MKKKYEKKKLKQNKENVMAELGKKIACESEKAAILSVLQRSGASVLDVVHFVRIRIDHFCVHRRLDKKNQMCCRFISIQDFEFLSISRLIVAFVQNLLTRHSSWLLFAGFIRWSVSMMNFFFFATMMIYLSFFFFPFLHYVRAMPLFWRTTACVSKDSREICMGTVDDKKQYHRIASLRYDDFIAPADWFVKRFSVVPSKRKKKRLVNDIT